MDATELAQALLEPVPAHRTARITVVRAIDGVATVRLETPPALHNVIGSLHSSGLTALADATGLAAMISMCRTPADFTDLLPLGTSAAIDFRAPGRGLLTGTCTLSADDRGLLVPVLRREQGKVRMRTTTEITDGHGILVASGTFTWSVRRATAATSGR